MLTVLLPRLPQSRLLLLLLTPTVLRLLRQQIPTASRQLQLAAIAGHQAVFPTQGLLPEALPRAAALLPQPPRLALEMEAHQPQGESQDLPLVQEAVDTVVHLRLPLLVHPTGLPLLTQLDPLMMSLPLLQLLHL